MGQFTYKTLIRDALVDDGTIQSLFNASTTGSTTVNMAHLYRTGTYPQIIIDYDAGETRSNLEADEGRITLTIESQGGSGLHAWKEIGKFRAAIINAIDDQPLSATAVCYLCRKFSEFEGYDDDRRVFWDRLSFLTEFRQNTSNP